MKKKSGLTGFGIVCIILLAVVMIVHVYMESGEEEIYMRILGGIFACVTTIPVAGIFYLAIVVAMYAAVKASGIIFGDEGQDEQLMDYFGKLGNPVSIICFVAAYISVFLYL